MQYQFQRFSTCISILLFNLIWTYISLSPSSGRFLEFLNIYNFSEIFAYFLIVPMKLNPNSESLWTKANVVYPLSMTIVRFSRFLLVTISTTTDCFDTPEKGHLHSFQMASSFQWCRWTCVRYSLYWAILSSRNQLFVYIPSLQESHGFFCRKNFLFARIKISIKDGDHFQTRLLRIRETALFTEPKHHFIRCQIATADVLFPAILFKSVKKRSSFAYSICLQSFHKIT